MIQNKLSSDKAIWLFVYFYFKFYELKIRMFAIVVTVVNGL